MTMTHRLTAAIHRLASHVFPTVENITADLSNTVKRLERLAVAKVKHVESLRATADDLHSQADAHEADIARAQRTSKNISKLLG